MEEIKITWYGHSCFSLTLEGYTVVLDPYAPGSVPGIAPLRTAAHAVLCSHGHADHNAWEAVNPLPARENPFQISMLPTYHDDRQGTLRGLNLIHILEGGGLRVAHLGDLGCPLTAEQTQLLTGLDALMIPVGGYFTIGPAKAAELILILKPRVVIPMHYRNRRYGYPQVGTLDDFLALTSRPVHHPGHTLTLTGENPEQIAVLSEEG